METRVKDWLQDDSLDPMKIASDLIDRLYQNVQYWPKPTGTGLVLMSYDGQVL